MSHAKVSSNSFSPVTFSYTYDKLGNILTAARTGYGTTTYTYDQQGQLLSEANTNYGSGTYEYDTFGNLRSKCFGQGEQYTYKYTDGQWRDLLTEVTYTTPAGTTTQTLVYDGCGNPLQYFNGRTYTMTWVNGRELNTAAVGGKTYSYEYDVNGLRTDKTVNGVTHHYTYAGGKLLREAYGNTTLDFLYDANGYPYILNHTVNGVTTTYYYITNPQGDVIRIVNTSGATVVNYYYDAWGQLRHSTDTSSNSIGTLNPLRYRGYYYDNETGFYYLQSRYYDPAICRFINADGYASTGQGFTGYNMFAYCNNSPASSTDPTGHRAMGPTYMYVNDGGAGEVAMGDTEALHKLLDHAEQLYDFEFSVEGSTCYYVQEFDMQVKDSFLKKVTRFFTNPIAGSVTDAALACVPVYGGAASLAFTIYTTAASTIDEVQLPPGDYNVLRLVVRTDTIDYNIENHTKITTTTYAITTWYCKPQGADLYKAICITYDWQDYITTEVINYV